MSTLVVRLSGPLQSWGEVAPHSERTTLPYPTYSGLLGLSRAALGHGRADDQQAVAWLYRLSMAVRIDTPGRLLTDMQTVNPRTKNNGEQQFVVPLGVMNGNGTARPWMANGRYPTALYHRHYLADAVFTWLVQGPTADLSRLADALLNPVWAVSLGRKACPPDFPLVLGVYTSTQLAAAKAVPRVSLTAGGVPLHILSGKAPAGGVPRTHDDRPLGTHAHDGYTRHTRHVLQVTPPIIDDRKALLTWAATNLDLQTVNT